MHRVALVAVDKIRGKLADATPWQMPLVDVACRHSMNSNTAWHAADARACVLYSRVVTRTSVCMCALSL